MLKLNKIIIPIIIIIAFIFVAWISYISIVFPKYHVDQNEILEKNKYPIVVLTGGKGRIEKGLQLLQNGTGNLLFISGVHPNVNIKNESFIESENGRLNECCIFFGKKAQDTLGNLKEVDDWLSQNNFNEFFLVSSYYHLPRVKLLFEKSMNDRKIHLIPVGKFPDTSIPIINQFHIIRILITEYLKIIYLIIFGF